MFNLIDIGHLLDELVITGAEEAHHGILFAGGLHTGDDTGTFLPLLHHLRYQTDGVLEVAVHLDRTVTGGLEHAVIGTVELSEVLGIEDGLDLRVALADLTQQRTGVVAGVVVDEHQLVVVLRQMGGHFLDNGLTDGYDVLFLVITGNQYTNLLHLSVWF